jgi:TolB-like protein
MIKRLLTILVLSFAVVIIVGAQDRMAVLDTVLPKGIDTGVVIPVTEKIMEEFVRSKLFIVLDRSFIAKTLSEQEFSASDLTSGDSAKLATIGGFLKASYIVVSTVQKLDTRFFLSAKMIEVKSGVIMAQTSVDRDGTISVLIDMAGELGRKLVAASMGQEAPKPSGRASAQPAQSAPPAQTAPPARVARQPREPRPSGARFSTVSADVGMGLTSANEVGTEYNYFTFVNGDYEPISGLYYGISAFIPSGLFYLSANLGMTTAIQDGILAYIEGQTLDIGMGVGLNAPFGPLLVYAGVRGGYMMFSLYEDHYTLGYTEISWAGISFGFETGADIRLGNYSLGVRYMIDMGTLTDVDEYWTDMDAAISSLSLRLGYAF